MEYPVEFDNLYMQANREVNDRFLHINSCGFQYKIGKKNITLRSKGRLDYLFLYIIKGSCEAQTQDGMTSVQAGNMLVYRPGESQYYAFSEYCENQAVYVHFTGSMAEEFAKFTGDKNIIHIENTEHAVKLFSRIVNDFVSGTDNMMSISWFIQLCELMKGNSNNVIDRRILEVLKYINKNYKENNSVCFYADMCGLSDDRFAHLFKKEVGMSPHKYITDVRIRQAKYLLEFSDLNVSEVATEVGMEDALYFSRIFKKYTGYPPKKLKG